MTDLTLSQRTKDFFLQFSPKIYKKGQIIIDLDNQQKKIHYIESGHVRQYVITKDGKDATLNIFKPGAFFPMALIVEDYKNSYIFEAMDEVTVRISDYEKVITFLKKEPDILLDLLQRLYRGIEGLLLRLENLMSGDAKKKLITILIISAKRFGKTTNNEIHVTLKMTHQDLANLTGLTRETISREMINLKQKNFIDYANTEIIIKDMFSLENELV